MKKRYSTQIIAKNMHTLVYYVTSEDLHMKTIKPEIPVNFFTKHNIGDCVTKRIPFHTSIEGALTTPENMDMGIYNVYVPAMEIAYKDFYFPKNNEVPIRNLTDEVWLKQDTVLYLIGKIVVLRKSEDNYKFNFTQNDKRKRLIINKYDWNWLTCNI